VQQELRRLAHRPHEQEQTDQRERVHVPGQEVNGLAGERGRLRENGVEVDRAGHQEHCENAERKAEIADAIDDEGLDGGAFASGFWYQKPMSR
jgi:uroporphyrinogen-III synthase